MLEILSMAKQETVKDWRTYSKYKRMVEELNFSSSDYGDAIYELCKVLEL